jgi:phage portal protein BeeE
VSLDDALNQSFDRSRSMVLRARAADPGGSYNFAPMTGMSLAAGLGATLAAGTNQLGLDVERYKHNVGWTFAAVRVIANRIAARPVRVARVLAGEDTPAALATQPGGLVAKKHHPLKQFVPDFLKSLTEQIEVLHAHPLLATFERPNPVMVRWSLLYITAFNLQLTGKAYWWVQQTKEGTEQIWPLPSNWVLPLHDRGLYSGWRIDPGSGVKPIDVDGGDVIFFHFPDPGDLFGATAPLQTQARAVVTDEAIQESQLRAFKNGIFPGVILTLGKVTDPSGGAVRPRLTPDQRQQFINAIKQMYRGALHFDEPIILDQVIESVTPFSKTPREMDFMTSGKMTKGRISQGFGVNPIIMGEVEGANRASAAVADAHLCDNVLNPIVELMSQVLTAYFARKSESSGEHLIVYLEPTRANDPEMLLKERDQLIKSGALLRNELRAMQGLPPMEGGDTIILQPGMMLVKPSAMANQDIIQPGKPNPPKPPKEEEKPPKEEDKPPQEEGKPAEDKPNE